MLDLVLSMYVDYYFFHFEFISAETDQHEFKKVLYVRQISCISLLLKRVIAN